MTYHDEPNWKDVRWDHGAADEAAAALRRAAAELERARDDDARLAMEAATEWRGDSREDFEQRRRPLHAELGDLAAACRDAAEHVRRASAQASAEQRRREAEREAWEREQERRRRSTVA